LSLKVTEPPSGVGLTVAVKATGAPTLGVVFDAVRTVVVGFGVTVTVHGALFVLAAKTVSPPYEACTEKVPGVV
jgi:hypothetical protein